MQSRNTSIDMICHNDILFNIIYGSNTQLLKTLNLEALDRLGQLWNIDNLHLQHYKALFFLLLEIDMSLKETVCKGAYGYQGVDAAKATSFFMALRAEAIDPFLHNTTLTLTDFMDRVKNLYLVY